MTRKKLDFRADAYRHVLGFVFHHWRHRPVLVGIIIVLVIASTLAEVMVPVFPARSSMPLPAATRLTGRCAPSSSSWLWA